MSNGWSVITSAPTNSQLAGVLAGFVFTGIIILFGRSGRANTRTLGLFCAAFVVLAFDSYLFSLISGGGFDPMCSRVWSETMAASGMLAVGGTALISGIAWLLADYTLVNHVQGDDGDAVVNMGKLSRHMVLGVAGGVTLLLGMTSLDYIYVVTGQPRGPLILTLCFYGVPIVVVGIAAALSRKRATRARLMSDVVEALPRKSLSLAIFCTLGYGIAGPLFAGGVTNIGDDVFIDTAAWLVALTLTMGFAVPVVLVVLLVYAVPHIEVRGLSPTEVSGTDEVPSVSEADEHDDGEPGPGGPSMS